MWSPDLVVQTLGYTVKGSVHVCECVLVRVLTCLGVTVYVSARSVWLPGWLCGICAATLCAIIIFVQLISCSLLQERTVSVLCDVHHLCCCRIPWVLCLSLIISPVHGCSDQTFCPPVTGGKLWFFLHESWMHRFLYPALHTGIEFRGSKFSNIGIIPQEH